MSGFRVQLWLSQEMPGTTEEFHMTIQTHLHILMTVLTCPEGDIPY